jgi:hypothetical protein
MRQRCAGPRMSQATKIVLGTVGVSAVLAIALMLAFIF